MDGDQYSHQTHDADRQPSLFAVIDRVRNEKTLRIIPDQTRCLEGYAMLGLVGPVLLVVPLKPRQSYPTKLYVQICKISRGYREAKSVLR
ncbi:hypothetical protein FHS25_000834 [Rhizobium laguerreae]|uniref:Transposase n=1 Tax=Rhizobium laguerreae TaxID=1076926 RepID=A0AAX2QVQ0_9HYPH|nr:hypothetical protein [Rhizobium laguerreae]TCU28570.1 hypothetical protein EV131_102404 [Rhizobium laguerreae]